VHPEQVDTVLVYLLLAGTPACAFWAARVGLERFTLGARPSTGASPSRRPLERLVADLRRLEQDQARIRASDEPRRAARLRAAGLAYDDTLRACCAAVGLPEPSSSPLSAVSRLHTEAALAQAGVTW
jgi:hypothetical protein